MKKVQRKQERTKSLLKVGGQSSYDKKFDKLALDVARLGATQVELADFFSVSEVTLIEWKKTHPTFALALKNGKMLSDSEVASKLYQRAIGFYKEEEKIFLSKTGEIVRATIKKYYAPDVTAQIFWLKNRQPENWRDRVDYEHTNEKMNPIIIEHRNKIGELSDDELDKRLAARKKN